MVLQDLDQCFTIYLSLTSSLGLANVQPHPDVSVLPVRAQGTSRYPLSHSVGADTELLRRLSYVPPSSGRVSMLRPVHGSGTYESSHWVARCGIGTWVSPNISDGSRGR